MKYTSKHKSIPNMVTYVCILCLVVFSALSANADQLGTIGVDEKGVGTSEVSLDSIDPVVTETGFISLSIDGLGTNDVNGGIIQVEKPAGATVRAAYMAAASTGFSNRTLLDGDVLIDGAGVNWDMTEASSISSFNHWADVTSLVKPKIDAAAAGRVDFTITEVSTLGIDGEILAVIFDDPNQTSTNTIVLLFGAQDIDGDTFAIALADPIDTSDPNLVLDMSLGISFGFQGTVQYSHVEVNGTRISTSAGGQDDGAPSNGALLTVGGLDDVNDNPANPFATPTDTRDDDELYNLIPFVADGDTNINVFTLNPSDDDNVFFGALFLGAATAVVGEGIILSPSTDTNPVDTEHTVTATVQDDEGNPVEGKVVTFTIVSGPNAGLSDTDTTDSDGKATFTYTGTVAGTDIIEASFEDSEDQTITSNQVEKIWEEANAIELKGFKAKTAGNGSVILLWETAVEIDNAGFNLYRSDAPGTRYNKINETLIEAAGGSFSGASYRYTDTPGEGTFFYLLEDVDYNGVSTLHGPVSNK
ncbi:MAG: PEF-CTERM sorting domain-containing protein [Candidatus Kuenenia sp.]|nr:PEF-CTERM sorting domain-containing protein [Candidatus Kuenenia hertensis]